MHQMHQFMQKIYGEGTAPSQTLPPGDRDTPSSPSAPRSSGLRRFVPLSPTGLGYKYHKQSWWWLHIRMKWDTIYALR